jgi:spore maturation protein CgeB
MTPRSLVLVGMTAEDQVAAHLLRAAGALGIDVQLMDADAAYRSNRLVKQFNWRLRGHRPTHLDAFSGAVEAACERKRHVCLITTGLAPLTPDSLRRLGERGIARINFSTDDPWNPAHRAPWFFEGLRHYDVIFTPRRRNLADFEQFGCRRVEYLPFAYSPDVHFPAPGGATVTDDVLFAGGADEERVTWITALIDAKFRIALYGGYWDRNRATAPHARGFATLADLRTAVASSRVCLCLVRRANRDGHAMRSFEVPAMGGCMLAEDTDEHRALFGDEGEAVLYFQDVKDMLAKARWLMDHGDERRRLAARARDRITGGAHTYCDRLAHMLKVEVAAFVH